MYSKVIRDNNSVVYLKVVKRVNLKISYTRRKINYVR